MNTDVVNMETLIDPTLSEWEAEQLLEQELRSFATRFASDRPDRKDSWC